MNRYANCGEKKTPKKTKLVLGAFIKRKAVYDKCDLLDQGCDIYTAEKCKNIIQCFMDKTCRVSDGEYVDRELDGLYSEQDIEAWDDIYGEEYLEAWNDIYGEDHLEA